jgi:hypothetical protein
VEALQKLELSIQLSSTDLVNKDGIGLMRNAELLRCDLTQNANG